MADNQWVCLGLKHPTVLRVIYNSMYNDRLGGHLYGIFLRQFFLYTKPIVPLAESWGMYLPKW